MENEKKLQSVFKELVQVNVNDYIEQKNGLNYLSWAFAVQEVCKRHDVDFDYEIEKFDRNLPYVYDEKTGYMVFTKVTLCGKTREMWLPVMDGANQAMKAEPYTYTVKKYEWNSETRRKEFLGNYEEKGVDAATMFDINKTIMRCLVKNLAMFGLGMYIYAGEDLPIEIEEPCTEAQVLRMRELKVLEANVCKKFKVKSIEQLTYKQAQFVITSKENDIATRAKANTETGGNQ